jgi:hypothetical protein
MIIAQDKAKRIVQSHDFDEVKCTIDAEDMRYVASLLRNNYSKPILAVIREITANALDANLEAGETKRVIVKVPSSFSPVFSVRDFGGGLSQEDIFGLYSKYGKSTKRDSNNYIGAFGIGKFAPLSYGNNFTCVSYYGGKKTSYDIYVNDDDDTKIAKLNEEPSSEPTGLCVEVAVADSDVEKFKEEVRSFFKVFPKDELPEFKGLDEDDFFPTYENALEGEGWFFVQQKNDRYYGNGYNYGSQSYAIMGRVAYPLDSSGLNFDGDDAEALRDLIQAKGFYAHFPIGDLKLHHSRESLEYNKNTQAKILERLREVKSEIEEQAKERLAGAEDLWDAKCKYAQVMNAIPQSLQNVFRNSFSWQGTKITSLTFDRPYGMHENLLIKEYRKRDDSDATDGYKVQTAQSSRVNCHSEALLVIQDAPKYGLSLRARTLFNENKDIEVIYAVEAKDQSAKDYMKDDWEFDLILPKNKVSLSEVDKAKLQQGTRSSGESRASVPLFQFDKPSHSYGRKNTDYWTNVDKKLDKLDFSDNKKKVYLAITAYRLTDHPDINLKQLDTRVRAVTEHNKDLIVYGVRNRDVKKLDKAEWVEFFDYMKEISIEYCKEHIGDIKKVRATREIQTSYQAKHWQNLQNLLSHDNIFSLLKLSKQHKLIRLHKQFEACKKASEGTEYNAMLLNEAEKHFLDDVNKIAPIEYTCDMLEADCKEICDKYPLLVNISNEISYYTNMVKDDFGKNIDDYIKLVDENEKKS